MGKVENEEFYEYFESTWLSIEDNKKSFNLILVIFFIFKKNKKKFIDENMIKNKDFYSNNCLESINHFI